MKVRNILAGLAVTTLVIGSASAAMAGNHRGDMGGYDGRGSCYNNGGGNCAYGNGVGMQNLTPEKQAAVDKLIQAHATKMEPLRQQLDAKRLELNALSGNPNAKPETISKLAEEVAQLNAQARKAGQEFRDEMSKELGVQNMGGMGRGMGGHGSRHGGMGWHNN